MKSGQRGEVRSLKVALGIYALLLVGKLAAYLLTGVMALLAEALHTLSDIFVSGFLLVALIYSRRPPDPVHAFGHGRAQNVAALVAATLFISFTSLQLYMEAIPRLWRPGEASYERLPLAAGTLIISMAIVAIPLLALLRGPRAGAAARAQFMELINDELGLLAALGGTLLAWKGIPAADPVASIVVATIIAVKGVGLFRDNADVLMGRSPDPEFLAEVERLARSVDGVLGVHALRAEYVGPDAVHVGMHVEVAPGLPVEDADRIAHQVEARVHEAVQPGFCVIHVDPAQVQRA